MGAIIPGDLEELSGRECLARLATTAIGRLAVTYKALPAVVPVRIRLVGDDLEIESLLGTTIPLLAGTVVALEAGTLGAGLSREWAVGVRGFLRARDDGAGSGRPSHSKGHAGTFWLSTADMSGWKSLR
jgi:hypothetical protein